MLCCRSASIYEFSTETLFFGRQDAMQRSALVPLAQHIRDNGLDPGSMRVMEACCGTGRFHTFLKVCPVPISNQLCACLVPVPCIWTCVRARDGGLLRHRTLPHVPQGNACAVLCFAAGELTSGGADVMSQFMFCYGATSSRCCLKT
jgi:hypothetical protein